MSSVFDWRGSPSIFGSLQVDANIARKASANLARKTKPDTTADAAQHILDGATLRDAAKRFDVREITLRYRLAKTEAGRAALESIAARRKKPEKQPDLRTLPLARRIDMQAARDYRMSGRSWRECAVKFDCSVKSITRRVGELYPETRRVQCKHGPIDCVLPLEQIALDVWSGTSLTAAARVYNISQNTLRRHLMKIEQGRLAVMMARERRGYAA